MANHRQAAKRARQSEHRRLRNMALKSNIRTRIRALRYSVDIVNQLEAGRTIHPQEVEKHLEWCSQGYGSDLEHLGFQDLVAQAQALQKKYAPKAHASFLRALAQADLKASTRLLGKAASKGVMHKSTVSRRISRLTKLVNSIQTA